MMLPGWFISGKAKLSTRYDHTVLCPETVKRVGISYNIVIMYGQADSDLFSACDDSEVEDKLESGVVEQTHRPA